MNPLLDEIERSTAALLASEDWAPTYAKAPKQHALLIKLTAKLQREVMVYLRDLAKQAPQLINWHNYSSALFEQQRALQTSQIEAYDVNVVINTDAVQQQDQAFIRIVFDTALAIVTAGADSMEEEGQPPIGLSSTSAIIQELTTEQLANLVGMRVDKQTGLITPNPNPAYSIDETTRGKIAQSIKTSIRLGEDHQAAARRLADIIADPKRADLIARNEAVRGYAEGRKAYAEQAGATGKYNVDSNAVDECTDNTAQGIIPFDDDFVFGGDSEPYHVNCKCQVVYVYGTPGTDFDFG